MNLKLGVMYDHNGTYIQGVGVSMFGHKIVVKLGENDKLQGACSYAHLLSACHPQRQPPALCVQLSYACHNHFRNASYLATTTVAGMMSHNALLCMQARPAYSRLTDGCMCSPR